MVTGCVALTDFFLLPLGSHEALDKREKKIYWNQAKMLQKTWGFFHIKIKWGKKNSLIRTIWEDPHVTILLFRLHAIGCLWNKIFKRSYGRNKTLNCPKEFVRTRQHSLDISGRIYEWHGLMRYKPVILSPFNGQCYLLAFRLHATVH